MKKIIILLAIVFNILLIGTSSNAQLVNPVNWSYGIKEIDNNELELQVTAQIDDVWHLYSQFFPDGGPIRLTFEFEKNGKYELLGKVAESPKPHAVFDEIFEIEVKYFSGKAIFIQKIKRLTSEPFNVNVAIDGQACHDENGMCVPVGDDYTFKIGKEKKESAVGEEKEESKKIDEKSTNESSKIGGEQAEKSKVDFSSMVSEAKIEKVELDQTEKPISNTGLPFNEGSSLWLFFWLSFIAGLIAILTPCVFPMIPMTVTFFMHSSEKKAKARFQAFVFGISIILIYTIVGTIVAVAFGADFANFLSTHWIPNILFFIIFMVFAASFLGMFEIVLPSWIVNKTDQQADKGGVMGAFFMALTLVVVSFSCTGPLVGAILVQSAGGQVLEPIVGMFGFSLAFALPFTLFAFFPQWLSNLPKSGGWLNSVKVVLGFVELALGLKFLSVADQTYHWGLLDRDVYIALWIVIFTLMGLYLLGKLKFSHDSDMKFIPVPRLVLSIATFAFVVYLIPGMFGAPLKALSGYLPPQTTHDFDLAAIIRDNAGGGGGEDQQSSLCGKSKYHEFLHLPHGLKGYFDYEQGLACAQKQNKPIFIDFTGHGCVNCREMEAAVWSDPEVLKRLREDYVIIALYVDDKTKLPEKDWVTSEYDGKVKKTLGKKYADFQITRFNVNAQPYYVLLDANEELLVQPRAYDLSVDGFVEFLDKGVEEFKKR